MVAESDNPWDDPEILRFIEIQDRVEFRKEAGKLERDIWIEASRVMFDPGERRPCWVCDKFRSITQAHHLVPLTAQYDRGFKYPDQAHIWLCPNHHALAHKFIYSDQRSLTPAAFAARDRRQGPVHEDLSEDEFQKMMELMRRAARGPE
jgi:hypothetical protein